MWVPRLKLPQPKRGLVLGTLRTPTSTAQSRHPAIGLLGKWFGYSFPLDAISALRPAWENVGDGCGPPMPCPQMAVVGEGVGRRVTRHKNGYMANPQRTSVFPLQTALLRPSTIFTLVGQTFPVPSRISPAWAVVPSPGRVLRYDASTPPAGLCGRLPSSWFIGNTASSVVRTMSSTENAYHHVHSDRNHYQESSSATKHHDLHRHHHEITSATSHNNLHRDFDLH